MVFLLKYYIPPVILQNQFEERIKLLRRIVLKTEKQIIASTAIFQTLVQKAFKGELV
jgi:type I restriction enzyme S subunit